MASTAAKSGSGVSIDMLDTWIEQLYECKPLSEAQIKQLCDKVRARGASQSGMNLALVATTI